MKIGLTADFTEDVYKQIRFLQMYRMSSNYPECPDARTGAFRLGRQTGHTTTLTKVANRLSREGEKVVIVTPNEQQAHHLSQYGVDESVLVSSASTIHRKLLGCSHNDRPTVILFDCYSNISQMNKDSLIAELEHICNRPVYFGMQ